MKNKLKKWCRHIIVRDNEHIYIGGGCALVSNIYGKIYYPRATTWKYCPKCGAKNPMVNINKKYIHGPQEFFGQDWRQK